MEHMIQRFFEVFIPLFVSIDAFGLLPVFLGITGGLSEQQRKKVAIQAVFVATLVSFAFMFLGQQIFFFLSITENDFRIAGGLLLLVLAMLDLFQSERPTVGEPEMVGIVPLAMPLIAGPATLTTALVLSARAEYGYALTGVSLVANFAILLGVLLASATIRRLVGLNALRAFSKLVMVLLAAIAVNFIRSGITNVIRGH